MLSPTISALALDQFAQRFEIYGCCLLRADFSPPELPQQVDWVDFYGKPGDAGNEVDFRLRIEAAIALKSLSTAHACEIVELWERDKPDADQLYGCVWDSSSHRYYLICWHPSLLTEQQCYGMTLYAHALSANLQTTSEPCQVQIQRLLQHNRHQLRTPLSLILLYTDLLQTIAHEPRSQEWVKNLRTTIEEMQVSLDHLTDLETATRQTTSVDFRQSVIRCIQGMQPWIDQKQLTLVCDVQPLWIQVNEWKMRQVLQNLLSNAIAFAPTGGQITWEWQTFHTEVIIKISDNGPGLSAEDLRSMGTPFYSRRPGGAGLGVAIAQQIVAEHHGSLWGQNLPNGGAQFCITLPRSA